MLCLLTFLHTCVCVAGCVACRQHFGQFALVPAGGAVGGMQGGAIAPAGQVGIVAV
jgi:hypothetical protein